MSTQKTLLFVGAHPDDETFGVGGTLAQYANDGVAVYYACATRGEVGSADPTKVRGYSTIGDMRWEELTCAAKVLGLADVIYLGYRDSGMAGSEDNEHTDALVNACLKQVTGKIVKTMREIMPQVVITFDPIGGYRHPDHIVVHDAAVKAFYAAGDPKQYVEAGPPFKPQKLYFTVFPRRFLKVAVKLLPFFGQDPHRFGKNKDINIASLVDMDFPVHARISISKPSVEKRNKAMACHASQSDGGSPRTGVFGFVNRMLGQNDLFMRAYPLTDNDVKEKDLFEGLD